MPKYNENGVKSNNSTLKSASDHETVNLVTIQNDRVITTSLKVAEYFGRNHSDVLRSIRNLDCSLEFNARNFALVKYKDAKGEERPMYHITRDGFTYLAMGFTGKIAAQFKETYIKAFNSMEEILRTSSFSKYANVLLSDAIGNLNRKLCEGVKKGRKEHGSAYGPAGCIQLLLPCNSMTFEDNLKNIISQLSCVYSDAFFLVSDLKKKESAISSYEDVFAEISHSLVKLL